MGRGLRSCRIQGWGFPSLSQKERDGLVGACLSSLFWSLRQEDRSKFES